MHFVRRASISMNSHRNRLAAGFTLVELVGVMVLTGLLAIVLLPRFAGTGEFEAGAFRDKVVSALRYAQKSAVSHRRLVCATFTQSSVTLSIAGTNPAATCGPNTLSAPDGATDFAVTGSPLLAAGVEPIHFQPSGLVTTAAGAVTDFSINVAGVQSITVIGATGYVD